VGEEGGGMGFSSSEHLMVAVNQSSEEFFFPPCGGVAVKKAFETMSVLINQH